jgi:murein DD-endopeptidase MepM/ murein hydrolase activator NlpD
MAINPQKLLPPSKISSPLANFSGLSIQKKTVEVSKITQLSVKYNEQNVDVVRKSLVNVDTLLKTVLTEDKNTTELKRRRKEREEFEERESNLEMPREQKKFRLPAVSLPGMSFLDRVKRFLLFTGIGWLFTNFQDQLPKLLGIIKIITPLYGVVENVFKFILSSVVNFIERGYEAYDKIRGLVKSIGGEGAQQSFDALSSKLNEYVNYILVGGLALSGAINAFASNVSKLKPQPQPQKPATGSRPTVTRGTGGAPVRTGAARVTTSGGKLAERNIAKNILRKTVKPALARLPVVGALIEFGLSWALGDPVGKAAFRGIGSLIVGAVGTAIGGPIGAAIGGLLGGEIGGRLYDTFFGGQKPPAYRNGGRVLRTYAKGGGVLGDYGLGRTLEIERSRRPTPPSQSTQPGRDVGGKKEIKRLFPNVNENILTIGRKPNPYYALENTASDFKTAPYGLGSLMGGAIDVALGQKMSNNTILNASVGLENMFYDNYDKDKNYIDVRSIIFGVIRSAADSALNNIQNELSKGKKKEEEKKEEDQQKQPGAGSPMPDQAIRVPSQANLPPLPPTNTLPGKQHYGAYRDGGRKHAGVDFDAGPNDTFYSRIGGVVTFIGNQPGGYYKYVDIYNKELNVTERIAEGDTILVSKGQTITPGTPVARGTNTTGVFHYEIRKGEKETYGFANTVDPIAFLKNNPVQKDETIASKPSGAGSTGKWAPLMSLIASKESGGNYEAMYPSTTLKGATKMTIAEVASKATGAVGKYQQLPQYLVGRAKAAGLDPNKDLYNPANQELIAAKVNIGMNRGGNQWLAGKLKTEDFMQGLSQEFAVLPNASGRFAHSGQGSSITPEQVKSALEKVKKAKKGGDISRISSSNNYIPKQPSKYNTKSIEMYPDYSEGGTGTRVAIQRIIVEKMIPIPMGGNKSVTFPVSGGVNNSTNLSNLSQG